jgi:hypothetical protein
MPEASVTPVTLKMGDILRVTNVGDRIFRGAWDLVDYVIPPGGSDYLPFEAVKLFFGDPRSGKDVRSDRDQRGTVGFVSDRSAEVRRLRLLYDHGFGDYTGHEGVEKVWQWDRIPHVEVHTLGGDRIWTVLDDPAGTTITPASRTEAEDRNLREVVAEQGQLIRQLMQRLGGIPDGPPAVPEENPPAVNPLVYHVDSDEIAPPIIEDPTADPTIYDELPEDR